MITHNYQNYNHNGGQIVWVRKLQMTMWNLIFCLLINLLSLVIFLARRLLLLNRLFWCFLQLHQLPRLLFNFVVNLQFWEQLFDFSIFDLLIFFNTVQKFLLLTREFGWLSIYLAHLKIDLLGDGAGLGLATWWSSILQIKVSLHLRIHHLNRRLSFLSINHFRLAFILRNLYSQLQIFRYKQVIELLQLIYLSLELVNLCFQLDVLFLEVDTFRLRSEQWCFRLLHI